MFQTIRRRLLVVLLVWPCLGAGPSKPGTDVVGGVGGGMYTIFAGCGAFDRDVREAQFHGRVSHQFRNPARVTVEATHSQGKVTEVRLASTEERGAEDWDPALAQGAPMRQTNVAVRGGAAWKYGGAEVGLLWRASQDGWRTPKIDPTPYFSGEAWAGHPDYVYGWVRCLAGAPNGLSSPPDRVPPLAMGVGHRRDRFHVEGGYGFNGLHLQGDGGVGRYLRLGAMASGWDAHNWSALATVGLRFDSKP